MSCRACVFPAETEQQWQTIACDDQTALRVWVQPGPDGYVRLQQLAHGDGLGWYVQKSFVVPGEALALLIPQLRQARCLIPASGSATLDVPETLRLVGDSDAKAMRRGA